MVHSGAVNLPPGEAGWPLIGEIREWLADPLVFAQERAARYGPVWRTHLLGRPCVVLLEPAGNQFMLSSGVQHFSWRDGWGRAMFDLIGGGLSLLDGSEHDQRRHLLRPALAHAALQEQFAAIQQLISQHCAQWASAGSLKLFAALKHLAFEIAALVICGTLPAPVVQALHADFDDFSAGLFTPLPFNLPGTIYGRAKQAGKRLRRILQTLINQRRASLQLSASDALSLMLQAEVNPPDDQAIIAELLLLLWAGHDTVAALLTWICYELACQPALAERLRQEYQTVLQSQPPTPATLRQLPELDRVIKEGERLHPPAPGGFRGVRQSFSYAGYQVPEGWLAMYSTVYTHHMPELWHAPASFNPDRFAPPRQEGHGIPGSLVGFGGGPRICIGLALAQMEMRLVLLELISNYRWELAAQQSFERIWLPTNQPRDGLNVLLTRR